MPLFQFSLLSSTRQLRGSNSSEKEHVVEYKGQDGSNELLLRVRIKHQGGGGRRDGVLLQDVGQDGEVFRTSQDGNSEGCGI